MARANTILQARADAPKSSGRGAVLFASNAGPSRYHLISLIMVALVLGSIAIAGTLLDGSIPFGATVSWTQRGLWAGGLVAAMLAFSWCVWFYQRRVVVRLQLSHDQKTLHITTPTFLSYHTVQVPLKDIVKSDYHAGDSAGEEAAARPWVHVHVRDQQSFVVPMSGGRMPNKSRLLDILSVAH